MRKGLLVMFLSILTLSVYATTHYASPTGTAAYIVSSPTNPMNLTYAKNSCVVGDSLLLEGTFNLTQNEYFANTDLYIGEYGAGAVITGSNDASTTGFSLFVFKSPSNLTVEGITFSDNWGTDSRGVLIWGEGNNVTVNNCQFYNIGWSTSTTAIAGSADGAHAILILGNKNTGSLTNVNVTNNTVSNLITGRNESITMIGNVDGFLIANNYITDVTNIGIDVAGHFSWVGDYDPPNDLLNAALNQARNGTIRNNSVIRAISPIATSAGIYCDGCRDVIIERNIVKESGAGISIGCEVGGGNTASNVTVINNIFRDNKESGMFLGSLASEESAQGPSSVDNCIVRNNTFYQNGADDTANDYEVFLQNSVGNVFSNNIFYIRDTGRGVVAAFGSDVETITITNNLFYRNSGNQSDLVISNSTSTLTNANSQWGDPGFTTASTNDVFEISNTSAAVNNGDPSTITLSGEFDRDGGVRVQNGTIDIGAQESDGTGGGTSSGSCELTPSYELDGTNWVQGSEGVNPSFNISTTNDVYFYPESADVTAGSWSWTGPNGFTSTSFDPYLSAPVDAGVYTATYTLGSCTSTAVYTITSGGGSGGTCDLTPSYELDGANWVQGSEGVNPSFNITTTNDVYFYPESADVTVGSWSWTGPNGFTSTSFDPYLSAPVDAGVYTVTYTLGSCSSTAVYTISSGGSSSSGATIDGVKDASYLALITGVTGSTFSSIYGFSDNDNIYIYADISDTNMAEYSTFINANGSTGYQVYWTGLIDYYVDGGYNSLNEYSATASDPGWPFESAASSAGIDFVRTSTAVEGKIPKSLIGLSGVVTGTVGIGMDGWTANWASATGEVPTSSSMVFLSLVPVSGSRLINDAETLDGSSEFKMSVYPNPVSDQVNLTYQMETEGKVRVEVYGANGQRFFYDVSSALEGVHTHSINLGQMPKGLAVIRVTANGELFTERLIIK